MKIIKKFIGFESIKSLHNVFQISLLASFVSGSRFIYMFYFSTIDTSNQKEVADIIFINGNNALFMSLFATLILIPIAQFKKYNLWGILSFIALAILISFLWHLIYDYEYKLIFLMILVLVCNMFYELTRRILFITRPDLVKILDITISLSYTIILGIFIFFNKNIFYYLLISSLFVLFFSIILFVKIKKTEYQSIKFLSFLKLNHSGFGQSLLMFISGNYIFQLVSFFGSSDIFTKVNIIRIWIAPIGIILNALDFVYSRDKYKGRVPNYILLFTLFISVILLSTINNDTALYCSVFFIIIPFQFWYRGLMIKLRQKILHKKIWKINLSFTFFSVIGSTVFVTVFHWKFWSWYLLTVYLIIWVIWKIGKKRELSL